MKLIKIFLFILFASVGSIFCMEQKGKEEVVFDDGTPADYTDYDDFDCEEHKKFHEHKKYDAINKNSCFSNRDCLWCFVHRAIRLGERERLEFQKNRLSWIFPIYCILAIKISEKIAALEKLLKNGADINYHWHYKNSTCYSGTIPSLFAVIIFLRQNEHLQKSGEKILDFLIEKGAHINLSIRMQARETLTTPLHIAAVLGLNNIVIKLLEHGAKMDSYAQDAVPKYPTVDENSSILDIAVEKDDLELVKIILETKPKNNTFDHDALLKIIVNRNNLWEKIKNEEIRNLLLPWKEIAEKK